MEGTQLIFFDIDQTLLDFKGAEKSAVEAIYDEFIDQSYFSKQDFYQSWQEIGEYHFKKYLRRELTFADQKVNRMRDLFNGTGETITDKQAHQFFDLYLGYFEDSWRAFDDVLPCLESLSGYRLGIITNGDESQQIKKLEKIGIADFFEVVVTSGKTGRSKPDPYIFESACREASVKPEQSIYVGDNLKVDILGSQSSNMKGIWINRDGISDEGHKVTSIACLTELKELL